MLLPSIATAIVSLAVIARLTRSSLMDVMNADYIKTFRSYGMPTSLIIRRHVFASVKEEKGKEYIEAARMLGASTTSILCRELLPNVISPLIVYATTLVGSMIVFSSGLSFLGLGIQPPDSDWGRMTGDESAEWYRFPSVSR